MRADRRGLAPADSDQDHSAACRSRPDLSQHLLAHSLLERIHLRPYLYFLDLQQDSAGRNHQQLCRWRRISLGDADGRRAGWLAAADRALFLRRRILCLRHDRRGEGVTPDPSMCGSLPDFPYRAWARAPISLRMVTCETLNWRARS